MHVSANTDVAQVKILKLLISLCILRSYSLAFKNNFQADEYYNDSNRIFSEGLLHQKIYMCIYHSKNALILHQKIVEQKNSCAIKSNKLLRVIDK